MLLAMDERRITPKQKMVLDYIETYDEARGYAPTQHEIAAKFGFKSLGTCSSDRQHGPVVQRLRHLFYTQETMVRFHPGLLK